MEVRSSDASNDKAAPVDDELAQKTLELKERLKELNCIYAVSEILENWKGKPDVALKNIVETLPLALKYETGACARIVHGAHTYSTKDFKETPWSLREDIIVNGRVGGSVEVCYLEEHPDEGLGFGPFLKEEAKLIRLVAERTGKFLEQFHADEELRKYRTDLGSLLSESGKGFDVMMRSQMGRDEDWQIILGILRKTDPSTLFRMSRKMIYHLSHYKNESFEVLMTKLNPNRGRSGEWFEENMPQPRLDLHSLEEVQLEVFEIARQKLTPLEILELLTIWLKQNKSRSLLQVSEQGKMSLGDIRKSLEQYMKIPIEDRMLPYEDDRSIRTSLIRRFMNERPEFMKVATDFLTIEDFDRMLKDFLGPVDGIGGLGGKASMIFLSERVIRQAQEKDPDLQGIMFARSWYLSTDTMREFIHYNALDEVAHIKYLDPNEIRKEQPFLEQVFKNGAFTLEIINGLREVLRSIENKPIIVRSSSYLEDSFGAAFSGKYKSLFIANKGTEDERLHSLMDAIAEVWASTFGPNPIEYRRERGMLDLMENMGVLIQEVVGTQVGPYFTPAFAGVAMSNNEFRWSPRISRQDGILRLVAGLGTRAVDRVADDYPTLISPFRPELRVNTNVDEAIQYSQKHMDVINLEKRHIETIDVSKMLQYHGGQYPMLNKVVSIHREGNLTNPTGKILDPGSEEMVVTFNGVIDRTPFIKQMKKIMTLLKETYQTPVDIEFAHDGKNLYILQCRPQSQGRSVERVPVPMNVPDNQVLFTADKYVTTGHISNVEYIVYVDPSGYESLEKKDDMLRVAKVVSDINVKLPRRKFILMGPGRWGSRGDIKLGVPVQYRDINNTSLLMEIAKRKGGYLPELSFGTHFFQDLVEADIHYLPLYPGEDMSRLNEDLLHMSENRLLEIVPDAIDLTEVVRVIHVPDIASGGNMNVVMDGEKNEAMAYLLPPDHASWRLRKVEEIAQSIEAKVHGVRALYLVGSVKEGTAGPASDIDLIIHFKGTIVQRDRLMEFLGEWSRRLDEENAARTGIKTGGLLDIHIITDMDILEKSSWAAHIHNLYNPAREIPIKR